MVCAGAGLGFLVVVFGRGLVRCVAGAPVRVRVGLGGGNGDGAVDASGVGESGAGESATSGDCTSPAAVVVAGAASGVEPDGLHPAVRTSARAAVAASVNIRGKVTPPGLSGGYRLSPADRSEWTVCPVPRGS